MRKNSFSILRLKIHSLFVISLLTVHCFSVDQIETGERLRVIFNFLTGIVPKE